MFINSRKQKKQNLETATEKERRKTKRVKQREAQMRQREMEILTQWKGRKSKLILLLCHTLLALQRGGERDKQVCCTALSLPAPLLLSVGGAQLLRDS